VRCLTKLLHIQSETGFLFSDCLELGGNFLFNLGSQFCLPTLKRLPQSLGFTLQSGQFILALLSFLLDVFTSDASFLVCRNGVVPLPKE
jgi:hypothetical protein